MNARSEIILACTLRILKPLARLLINSGVTYPALAQALKPVFLEAARLELDKRSMPATDSAMSLLSGVHRRDVRNLTRLAPRADQVEREPLGLVAQVVARWLTDPQFVGVKGRPKTLVRAQADAGFDYLVSQLSSDVRPRAVLDEMLRLGVVEETEAGVRLLERGLAPRQGLQEMSWLVADNVHDHLAAAASNLQAQGNFLEQALFVDQITAESAERLHKVSSEAWGKALKTVMKEAQQRFDEDAQFARPEERTHRARFGTYFYSNDKD